MESVQNRSPKIAYLWLGLSALSTILLCGATHIDLTILPYKTDTAKATLEILSLILKILTVVPLLCVTPMLWSRVTWFGGPYMLPLFVTLSYGTGLIFGEGFLGSLYFVGMIAPAGIILFLLQRYRYSNFYTVFYLSIVLLAGLFIRVSLPALINSHDAFLPMRETVASYRVLWDAVSEGAVTEEAGSVIQEMLKEMKLEPEQYLIGLLYYPAALAALTNGVLSHVFNRGGEAELVELPPFEEWTVERGYVFGSLALTVVSYILSITGQRYGDALLQIAYLVWMLPMSLAGVCYLKKRTKGKTWLFVLITVLAISMYSIFAWALSLMGMLGFFRKEQDKRKQGGSEK